MLHGSTGGPYNGVVWGYVGLPGNPIALGAIIRGFGDWP